MSDNSSDHIFNKPVETVVPREGLPRQYRMRADRHYVDQLASSSSGQPVRMIPVLELDGGAVDSTATLRPLIESIRIHGIVQPLLVRRHESRYEVVAGRKRLLAAITLQLSTVPCLVHDIADEDAGALAAADNIRIGALSAGAEGQTHPAGVIGVVASHLSGIRGCADLCERGAGLQTHALDLLKAHAWRAARVLDAFNLVGGGPSAPPRERTLAAILAEVADGFATECRLSGVSIQPEVRDHVSSAGLHDGQIVAGVSGALLAMLPLVERAVRPVLVVTAANTSGSEVSIEILQTCVPIAPHVADRFFRGNPSAGVVEDATAALGASAVKALADAHDGRVSFEPLPHGSRLAIVLRRRS